MTELILRAGRSRYLKVRPVISNGLDQNIR